MHHPALLVSFVGRRLSPLLCTAQPACIHWLTSGASLGCGVAVGVSLCQPQQRRGGPNFEVVVFPVVTLCCDPCAPFAQTVFPCCIVFHAYRGHGVRQLQQRRCIVCLLTVDSKTKLLALRQLQIAVGGPLQAPQTLGMQPPMEPKSGSAAVQTQTDCPTSPKGHRSAFIAEMGIIL